MDYYLGTISYYDKNNNVNHNTVLIKASSNKLAADGLKKHFFNKGITIDNFIKVEIHKTILCK